MCPDKKTLSAWFDGNLSRTALDIIKEHAAHCADCSKQIEEWTVTRNLLLSLDETAPAVPDFEQLLSSRNETKVIPFWKREIPWTYAAGLALLFSLSTLIAGFGLNQNRIEGNSVPMVNIQKWDDSSHFTLLSGEEAELLFQQDIENSQTLFIDVDTSLSYMGESELMHNASWNGGNP